MKTFRDYKHLNYQQLCTDLQAIPWHNIYQIDDVNGKLNVLNKTYRLSKIYIFPLKFVVLKIIPNPGNQII